MKMKINKVMKKIVIIIITLTTFISSAFAQYLQQRLEWTTHTVKHYKFDENGGRVDKPFLEKPEVMRVALDEIEETVTLGNKTYKYDTYEHLGTCDWSIYMVEVGVTLDDGHKVLVYIHHHYNSTDGTSLISVQDGNTYIQWLMEPTRQFDNPFAPKKEPRTISATVIFGQ